MCLPAMRGLGLSGFVRFGELQLFACLPCVWCVPLSPISPRAGWPLMLKIYLLLSIPEDNLHLCD